MDSPTPPKQELDAIVTVCVALEPLDAKARERVLDYVMQRLGMVKSITLAEAQPGQPDDVVTAVRLLVERFGSQAAAAKRIGVSQATVCKWSLGRQDPSKSDWDKVLAVCHQLKNGRSKFE